MAHKPKGRKPKRKRLDAEGDKILGSLEHHKLRALHRVAKARGRAFFRDPRAMMNLRERVAWRD